MLKKIEYNLLIKKVNRKYKEDHEGTCDLDNEELKLLKKLVYGEILTKEEYREIIEVLQLVYEDEKYIRDDMEKLWNC